MTYVITGPCTGVKDKTCAGECPAGSIYEGQRMPCIHSGECVDCGACEAACPVEAVFCEDDVPSQWAQFTTGNVRFFSDRPAAPPRPARCPTTPTTSLATSPAGNATMSVRQISNRGRVSGGPVPGSPGRPPGSR
jgi:NAD-dependent dihydropyrimidine dehydrogenase PreA subunit